jgi:hypothetical protein
MHPFIHASFAAASFTIILVSGTSGVSAQSVPNGQSAFLRAVSTAQDAFANAPNDMAAGAVRAQRKVAICNSLSSLSFSGWVGKITKMSANSEGKGVLEIEIAPNVSLKTWNNSFSDRNDITLIDPNSTLFQKVVRLSVGAKVRIDGNFIRDSIDCVHEASMSTSGSMRDPEFIVRFNDLNPI